MFSVGDKIVEGDTVQHASRGRVVDTVRRVHLSARSVVARVEWGGGWPFAWHPVEELTLVTASDPARQPVCECGAAKCKTTHATYCPLHESGGTVPYVRPERRMF